MQAFESSLDEDTSLYESVLDDISSGYLAGGQRLKVAELAKRYGVSTSPVREVLRRMQGEGYVDISPNRGATVRRADANTIQNIFEILQLLEPYFVAWFANFARPEMVEEMEAIQREIAKTPLSDLQRFRTLDTEFHWRICKRHYNQMAAEKWKNLRRALNVHGAKLLISPARYATIMEEHDGLLTAFRSNDVERATDVIRRHLEGSFTQMSQQMRLIAD
jgi:DNA-binding GntR family transcriptional regulator